MRGRRQNDARDDHDDGWRADVSDGATIGLGLSIRSNVGVRGREARDYASRLLRNSIRADLIPVWMKSFPFQRSGRLRWMASA